MASLKPSYFTDGNPVVLHQSTYSPLVIGRDSAPPLQKYWALTSTDTPVTSSPAPGQTLAAEGTFDDFIPRGKWHSAYASLRAHQIAPVGLAKWTLS